MFRSHPHWSAVMPSAIAAGASEHPQFEGDISGFEVPSERLGHSPGPKQTTAFWHGINVIIRAFTTRGSDRPPSRSGETLGWHWCTAGAYQKYGALSQRTVESWAWSWEEEHLVKKAKVVRLQFRFNMFSCSSWSNIAIWPMIVDKHVNVAASCFTRPSWQLKWNQGSVQKAKWWSKISCLWWSISFGMFWGAIISFCWKRRPFPDHTLFPCRSTRFFFPGTLMRLQPERW